MMRARKASSLPLELGALALAVALTLGVVAHLVNEPRAVLLFSDGDSMLPVLMMRSIETGQPQDWAMSSVLFIPELLLFAGLWQLKLGFFWTIVANGIVNLLLLYGALRLVAGTISRRAVLGALIAFATFCGMFALEFSASRDSLELASLLATTTYYSATVIGGIATIGLLRIIMQGTRPSVGLLAIGLVSCLSALSNPLYLLWVVVPVVPLMLLIFARMRTLVCLAGAAAIGIGSAVGFGLRIAFAEHIANDGMGYIQPEMWYQSATYYARLLLERVTAPGGILWISILFVSLGFAIYATIRLRRTPPLMFVAAAGWVIPVIVVLAAIGLGTHASRYLQPAVFAPITSLAIAPFLLRAPMRSLRGGTAMLLGFTALALSAIPSTLALASASNDRDEDLACVVDWVDASGRVGGGQFWTVRLPKARIGDPRNLVQVDSALRPYHWIVNKDDSAAGQLSFVIVDSQSQPFDFEGDLSDARRSFVACGRYTIIDFEAEIIPLGTPHS